MNLKSFVCVIYDLTHKIGYNVGNHRDDSSSTTFVFGFPCLVIISRPTTDALFSIIFYTFVAHALLYTKEIFMLGKALYDSRWDVLSGTRRDVVDECWTEI
eukprot:TRINITY_DN4163_c0_g1_i1.p1 TRINITY_DN4163_c0_g1~~TRINITY_DN4163_c0_g1_i1.p1  ORF type:complete len:101 (+),score=6.64 TRINITY_DN4163_c0_g1_i1:100-402(+)